jgi:hypothetical protein
MTHDDKRSSLWLSLSVLACCAALSGGCGNKWKGEGDAPSPQGGEDSGKMDTELEADNRSVSGQALCGGGGQASDGSHTVVACVAPAEVALTTESTDGTYVLLSGAIHRISP